MNRRLHIEKSVRFILTCFLILLVLAGPAAAIAPAAAQLGKMGQLQLPPGMEFRTGPPARQLLEELQVHVDHELLGVALPGTDAGEAPAWIFPFTYHDRGRLSDRARFDLPTKNPHLLAEIQADYDRQHGAPYSVLLVYEQLMAGLDLNPEQRYRHRDGTEDKAEEGLLTLVLETHVSPPGKLGFIRRTLETWQGWPRPARYILIVAVFGLGGILARPKTLRQGLKEDGLR